MHATHARAHSWRAWVELLSEADVHFCHSITVEASSLATAKELWNPISLWMRIHFDRFGVLSGMCRHASKNEE
jgi:hypothetical protein